MTVKCITPANQALIAEWYSQKLFTQKELAKRFNVSERTIGRVLWSKGLTTTRQATAALKPQDQALLDLARQHGLTAEKLKEILNSPVLSMQNVEQFLYSCTQNQLATLFYRSGLVKIYEQLAKNSPQKEIPEVAHEQFKYGQFHL